MWQVFLASEKKRWVGPLGPDWVRRSKPQNTCDLRWINRERLAEGRRPRGSRRVVIPTRLDQQMRELTSSRQRLGRLRTRTLNQIQGLLRRSNLIWESPDKNGSFSTIQSRMTSTEENTSRKPLDNRGSFGDGHPTSAP